MTLDIMKVLEGKKALIWPELQKYLPNKEPKFHYALVRDYPERGGKYLRAGLILLSCEAFGGDPAKAVRTAAAMEASQNWILIHDDIQDHSDERRGKPCLHKVVGIEQALNAGDALHIIMWKILTDNREVLGEEMTFRVMDYFNNMLLVTAEGQSIEMVWTDDKTLSMTEEDYYKIVDTKAGLYTITGPMSLGAMIAGATQEQLKLLERFGLPFGRAFQIQDDVLNLTGDPKKYGKEIGGDILEGKRTLMLIHLLKHCSAAEKEKIKEIYARPRERKTQSDVSEALSLMKKYGSIEYARKKSFEFAAQAQRIFDTKFTFLKEGPAKEGLRAAVDFVVKREL
ncbi:MAG: polyprenyl synthetase family protein [Candidatus Aenigmatarchaeota archaeon]